MPTTCGIVFLDDFYGIADVVAVTVCDQQCVDLLHLLLGRGTGGIVHDPRIDNDGLPARRFDAKCRVAQPRKLNAFQIHGR
jgi:hypothetical protein